MLAAHQFMGILNEFSLWPLMVGRKSELASDDEVVEEALRMFLQRYRLPKREMVPGLSEVRRRSRRASSPS